MAAPNEEIGKRIQKVRKSKGLTQLELAKKVGEKSGRIVSEWEHGTMPSASKIFLIADALGTSPNYLLGYEGDSYELSPVEEARTAKIRALDSDGRRAVDAVLEIEYERCTRPERSHRTVIHTRLIPFIPLPVSAGTGLDLNADDRAEPILIPLTDVSRRADFVLRITGDSMEPEYQNGELLLIESTNELRPGELGVFALNGEGYFKKLGEGELVSLNGAYDPIRFKDGDELQAYGRVVGTTERIIESNE